jgi:hypothetical protein
VEEQLLQALLEDLDAEREQLMSSYENHSLPVRAASSVRVVVNEIPGGVRSFIHAMPQLKIGWACCVTLYAFIGASIECSTGEKIAWYVVFTILWTVAFAGLAAWNDAYDQE